MYAKNTLALTSGLCASLRWLINTWKTDAITLVSVTDAALGHDVEFSETSGSSPTARHSNASAVPASYSSDGHPVPTAMTLSKSNGWLPHVLITSRPASAAEPRSIDTRSAR